MRIQARRRIRAMARKPQAHTARSAMIGQFAECCAAGAKESVPGTGCASWIMACATAGAAMGGALRGSAFHRVVPRPISSENGTRNLSEAVSQSA
jgi:hypothetical protein